MKILVTTIVALAIAAPVTAKTPEDIAAICADTNANASTLWRMSNCQGTTTPALAEPAACERTRDNLRTAYNEIAAKSDLPTWEDYASAGFGLSAKMAITMAGSESGSSMDMTMAELERDVEISSRYLQLNLSMRALRCEWR